MLVCEIYVDVVQVLFAMGFVATDEEVTGLCLEKALHSGNFQFTSNAIVI